MPIWKPDLSKGAADFSGVESVSRETRLAMVDAPGRGPALKFRVRQGDFPAGTSKSGARCEVFRQGKWAEGTERFHAFSVYFPKSFPTLAKSWQVFAQWHQEYIQDKTVGRSPPVEFALYGDSMRLNTNDWREPTFAATTHWQMPLVRERWLDFVLHAKWSSDPKVGFVRLFLNGIEVLPKKNAATMFPGYGVYQKHGLYRKDDIQPEGVVYHGNILETDSLSEALYAVAEVEPGTLTPVSQVPPVASVTAPLSFSAVDPKGQWWSIKVEPEAAPG